MVVNERASSQVIKWSQAQIPAYDGDYLCMLVLPNAERLARHLPTYIRLTVSQFLL